jgi:hypothetical protein
MWSRYQQRRAMNDGWGIFDNSDHGMRIERNDDMGRFETDNAAQAYVAMRAIGGNVLAIAAWEELAHYHAVSDIAVTQCPTSP